MTMSHKHPKKIEIATPEDVARYAPAPEGAAPAPGGPGEGEAPPQAAEAPPAETETLRAELEQWKDKALRARAELANFQRRSSQERTEAIRYANADFARGLLGVVDDLERAATHSDERRTEDDPIVRAVKLIHENLLKLLTQHSVEPIRAVGERFDPALHEAVMQRESGEHPEATVLEELQKGYRMHDRVLRPTKVVVSKPAAPAGEAPKDEAGSKE